MRTVAFLNASLAIDFAEKYLGHGSPAGLGDDRDGNHHIGVAAVVDDGHLVQQGSHWGVERDVQGAFRRGISCNWGSDLGHSNRSLHWHFLHDCVGTKECGTSDEPGERCTSSADKPTVQTGHWQDRNRRTGSGLETGEDYRGARRAADEDFGRKRGRIAAVERDSNQPVVAGQDKDKAAAEGWVKQTQNDR